MVGVLLIFQLLVQPPDVFDLDLDELPPYAQVPSHQVEKATPEQVEAVDWDSPAPKIRTVSQFREAKDRAVPVIWFEGRVYCLSPEGKYRDPSEPLVPTPTPRPFGEVELANGTAHPVEFYVRLAFNPRTVRSVKVDAFDSKRAVLPLGIWQYVVVGAKPDENYPSRGEFSVEPYGTTHILYGFPGRSVERARDWMQQEEEVTASDHSTSQPGQKPFHGSEEKTSQIFAGIPLYPNALRMELPVSLPEYALFKTLDSEAEVLAFYERTFNEQGWDPLEQRENLVSFVKPDRKAVVEILPASKDAVSRQFVLRVYPLE